MNADLQNAIVLSNIQTGKMHPMFKCAVLRMLVAETLHSDIMTHSITWVESSRDKPIGTGDVG